MATTVPDGIWTPDDSTAYNLPVDLAAMADTVQTGLNNVRGEITSQNQQFYGPAAGRTALTGVKPGDTYQEADGSKIQWVQTTGGLWRVHNSPPTTLALNAGWTNPGGIPATYGVRSGILMLWGRLSGTTGAGAVVATLPPDYRPLQEIVVMYVDGATLRDFIIGVSGTLTAYGKSGAVADMRLSTVPPFAIK